jgi:(1->4)-alpha-D-glucan 1-alpha-D-glucosylmutase
VQLHAEFGFRDLAGVAAYLADLGVSHVYCSPYLQASIGSTHGYDVVDPRRLDLGLGGAASHAELTAALRAQGLGQVLDVVPNHMAADPDNEWWWDVLENGPASRFARFFDIDWESGDDKSAFTVLVPVLADHYGRALEGGEFTIRRDGGRFVVRYHDHRLPLSPRTVDGLLAGAARRAGSSELARLGERFGELPHARFTDQTAVAERYERGRELVDALGILCEADARLAAAVDDEVAVLNQDYDRLDQLLRRQNYRLARWRTASEELDYRRFFNIETLVGVRVEDPDVFAATHQLVLELVRDGTVQGLRIDHVDGLRDPEAYLARLSERAGGTYTVVEKILARSEQLPDSWPVAGTSGYDFLNRVNQLFVASANEPEMTAYYAEFTGEHSSYDEVVMHAKQHVMAHEFAAEVDHVTGLLAELCDQNRRHRDHTRRELRAAVREVVAHFPVYRTYVRPGGVGRDADRDVVATAVAAAIESHPEFDEELLRFLGELALGGHELDGDQGVEFVQRLQQLTAPVMAKGVEDTAFYRYHRLVSLNEVGGDPGLFGRALDDFHVDTALAADHWPASMLTLSTHDTKRSADVRARLNTLSEIPDAWRRAVTRWADCNRRYWPGASDLNTEYLLYQTLVGAWPLEAERVVRFMSKATKEAKVQTSWTSPNADYDAAVESFARSILADVEFRADLEQFLTDNRVVDRGRRNSLAQTTLMLTCPGVPDIYQGNELWDLSLVDPDNRRPVDYAHRRRLLDELDRAGPHAAVAAVEEGGPKLWLTRALLRHRRAAPDLYVGGRYEPMELRGARANDAVAFHRGDLAVVVPRLGGDDWADTTVWLPSGHWSNVLTGEGVDGGHQRVGSLLAPSAVVVLERERA